MRVGIAGGGIGGLALAHGLRRQGFETVVFERDARPRDTAGYRLHLTPASLGALRGLLPPGLAAAIEGTAAAPGTFRQIAVLDHRGRTRIRLPIPGADNLLIGRRPLRELLARGLGDVVRWGTRVTAVREHPGGVTVHTGDGPATELDVLVGADGIRSVVTQHLTGRPAARPAGVAAIAGTVQLCDRPVAAPADLRRGLGLAIGPRGTGMFLAAHHPRTGDLPDGVIRERPYLVWSVAAPLDRFSADVTGMRPELLLAEALALTARWSPGYRDLLAASDPGSVAAFPFVFPGALGPWRSDRITLIGDAVHPMPPTAGAGASTALVDAGHLSADLAEASVPVALARFQNRMLAYAPAAVDEARPALDWQRRLANPLLRVLAVEVAFPLVAAVTAPWSRQYPDGSRGV
ncbi:FAD-dependent oxidoreductase [Paractinoplanes rishiriensis]|nr:FAD-dependent monooxygenase [Actinoplanes rishiriensis]